MVAFCYLLFFQLFLSEACVNTEPASDFSVLVALFCDNTFPAKDVTLGELFSFFAILICKR